MKDATAKRLFVAGIVTLTSFFLLSLGYLVAWNGWWPHQQIQDGITAVQSIFTHGEIVQPGRVVNPPKHAMRQPWTVHRPAAQLPGQYLIVGYDITAGAFMARLFDANGGLLHRWSVDYGKLDPEWAHKSPAPHPVSVLPDGSLMVGYSKGSRSMARFDTCGKPIWIKKGYFHHGMDRANDGSYWIWRAEHFVFGNFQYLHNFDPETGEVLREIGLIEDIIRPAEAKALQFGVRHDARFKPSKPPHEKTPDIFHPNDVDVLDTELADAFPMFEAGDLMVSFRSLNMIAVLDVRTGAPKWIHQGPWLDQHDPDFLPDGWISVYANNRKRGSSEIIQVNPANGAIRVPLYDGEARFYSVSMGKHQTLPNGNVLIVVPGEGRVLEVTADGDRVMEFNNMTAPGSATNQHVEHAFWLPLDYFAQTPGCPET